MNRHAFLMLAAGVLILALGCTTAYNAQPLPFRTPAAYDNMVETHGIQVGAQAFTNTETAQKAFGFDVRGAGMLPVQVVFDNQGRRSVEINPGQTFLEDRRGNLWPVLTDNFAYERATKYAQTQEMFKEGTYKGFLGAAAGTIIGAAIGIVSGDDVARTTAEGAVIGAAAGAVLGGASGYTANDARATVIRDLKNKSLENQAIEPGNLTHGLSSSPVRRRAPNNCACSSGRTTVGKCTRCSSDFSDWAPEISVGWWVAFGAISGTHRPAAIIRSVRSML